MTDREIDVGEASGPYMGASMSAQAAGQPALEGAGEPTPALIWQSVTGCLITDRLLEWPPDVFALTNLVLDRAEAFRFALSPVGQWPPGRYPDWTQAVVEAGRRWSGWAQAPAGEPPDLVAHEWKVFCERAETPLEDLTGGRDWRLAEALLTLHAVADEACAGLGIALDASDASGCVYRVRGRELLARTGSLARIDARLLRVLPKVRTPPTGRPAFSCYACVQAPPIEARWHKLPARHYGTDLRSEYATMLLLPWPLTVRAADFHPVEGSVRRLAKDPFASFEFAPAERLDLALVDRVLTAARQEVNAIDIVMLPESAVDESEVEDLEALLDRHGVISLHTGVRQRATDPARPPGNWIHAGFNPRLRKGGPLPSGDGEAWFHIRQNKHHRWSLDESQINQYHLGSALHPLIRWWEAMEVPRQAVQFVEVAELVIVSLVCQDLAESDNVAGLIRSVGPTCVLAGLLDGPQLTSRWAARYASVLADDPGSAVLALSSLGMVERSRPHDHGSSRIVALWKDPNTGVREISLEPGAHGIVLTLCMDRASRRTADGRWPVDNATSCSAVAVYQVRASDSGSGLPLSRSAPPAAQLLEGEELTILTVWAEGISEALAYAPGHLDALMSEARGGAPWRAGLGLPEPSARLSTALDSLGRLAATVAAVPAPDRFDAILRAARHDPPGEPALDGLARRVLLAMLEERRTRQPAQA
jgi:hypothetical protein